jgi:hypothetical protein
LARIIRQDARHEYYSGRVTVTLRCCGVKILRVSYAMKPEGGITGGEYVLTLETVHRKVREITVEESSDSSGEMSYGHQSNTFVLSKTSERRPGRWGWGFTHYDSSSIVGPEGFKEAMGGASDCPTSGRLSRTVYGEVLRVLKGAPKEAFVPFSRSPLEICGPLAR